jgi:hypothetical protein
MNKDIVIYLKATRDILAIITNTSLGEYSEIVANDIIEVEEVDNTKEYIIRDEETGKVKFANLDSKILYIEDYR